MARRKTRGKKGRKFTYKRRDPSTVEKRASQQGGMYDKAYKDEYKKWAPKAGDNIIRVLPPTWDDPDHYGIDVWMHYNVGPDNQSYLCPHKMKGEKCPVCEAIANAVRNGTQDDEWVNRMKPKRRVLVWMVDRDKEGDGAQLYDMPWTLDRDLSKSQKNKRTGEVYVVDDPYEGYDLEFTKEKSGEYWNYAATATARDQSPLLDNAGDMEEMLQFAVDNPLPDTLQFFPYEHIDKVFAGGAAPDDDEDDEDDDDEAPWDEWDDESDEDTDDDESDEDDEDEDWDDEDESLDDDPDDEDWDDDESDEDEDWDDEEEDDPDDDWDDEDDDDPDDDEDDDDWEDDDEDWEDEEEEEAPPPKKRTARRKAPAKKKAAKKKAAKKKASKKKAAKKKAAKKKTAKKKASKKAAKKKTRRRR